MKSILVAFLRSIVLIIGIIIPMIASMFPAPLLAADLAWSEINIPNGQFSEGTSIDFLASAADGHTLFAYSNAAAANRLYKSADGGNTWTNALTTGVPNGLDGVTLTGLEVSSGFASDNTLIATTAENVYLSQNGGGSFGTNTGFSGKSIQCVAVGPGAGGSGFSILVGTATRMWIFTSASGKWEDQTAVAGSKAVSLPAIHSAIGVAFSPNFLIDGLVLVITVEDGTTKLHYRSISASNRWDNLSNGTIPTLAANASTRAVFGFGADFTLDRPTVLVGLSGGVRDDLYRVTLLVRATWTDLNVGGPGNSTLPPVTTSSVSPTVTGTVTPISSVAVDGPLTAGTVYAGKAAGGIVRCTGASGAPTWNLSFKNPTGTNPIVRVLPDRVIAGTSGGPGLSAFHVSTDGGATFNKLALLSLASLREVRIKNMAVVDANTTFLLFGSSSGDVLFRTTDGGNSWNCVNSNTDSSFLGVYVSPAYATDNTIYVPSMTSPARVSTSNNGGSTFAMRTLDVSPITAFLAIDGTAYYAGFSGGIFKPGRSIKSGIYSGSPYSIARVRSGEIIIGTNQGEVYFSTDDGLSFGRLGNANEFGSGNSFCVAADPAFADNKYIYAASYGVGVPGKTGVFRWKWGVSSQWERLTDAPGISGLGMGADGTLYAASLVAGASVYRCLNPAESPNNQIWEPMANPKLIGYNSGYSVRCLNILSGQGANNIYAAITGAPRSSYGDSNRLLVFRDTLIGAPAVTSPVDGVKISAGANLTWSALDSPVALAYRFQIAAGPDFSEIIQEGTTAGTSIQVPPINAGRQYYWRVFVDKGQPLTSRKSKPLSFTFAITGQPLITANPSVGAPGSLVTIQGSGFPSSVQVTITMDGTTRTIISSDSKGAFSAAISVPETSPGDKTIQAIAGDIAARASYNIQSPKIRISPSSGAPGSMLTVEGSGFPASSSGTITLNQSVSAGFTTADNGTFTASVAVPKSSSGRLTVAATAGSVSGSATFEVVPVTAPPVLIPDLTVSSNPIRIEENGSILIIPLTISNVGGGASPATQISINDQEQQIPGLIVPLAALGPGETRDLPVRLEIPKNQRGNAHIFQVAVSPGEREINTGNNFITVESPAEAGFPATPVIIGGGIVLAGAVTVVLVKILIAKAAAKTAAEAAAKAAFKTMAKPPQGPSPAAKAATAGAAAPITAAAAKQKLQAYPRLDAPQNVAPQETFDITIGLSSLKYPGTIGKIMIIPTDDQEFDLIVRVIAHDFKAPEGVQRFLHVIRDNIEEVEVKVQLIAPATPTLLEIPLEVEYAYGGNLIGRAWRKIRVVPEGVIAPAGKLSIGSTPIVSVSPESTPDLTVTISDIPGEPSLEWNFLSPYPCKMPAEQIRTKFTQQDAERFATEKIMAVPNYTGTGFEDNLLKNIAGDISENMPPQFWTILNQVWQKVKESDVKQVPTLLIISSDPYVPWELASTDSRWVKQSFIDPSSPLILGAQLKIGRWIPEGPETLQGAGLPKNPPDTNIDIKKMALIIGNYRHAGVIKPLKEAVKEGETLRKSYPSIKVPGTSRQVDAVLDDKYTENGNAVALQVLHFACHGEVNPGTPDNGIILNDGTHLTGDILKNRELLKNCQPLVFMNACEVGYSGKTLASYGGMAGACLSSGSRSFIAPLWKVNDKVAHELAIEFYKNTVDEKIEVSEAMRRFRSRFHFEADNPESTYLAYIFYGHPKLVLTKSY